MIKYETIQGSQDNLKIININVEEQSTGEISAGAGVGTSGGTIAFNIKENNWLGRGKALSFDIQLDEESLIGSLSYSDPNYDFLNHSFLIAKRSSIQPRCGNLKFSIPH